MSTFINVNLEKRINRKYIKTHLTFFLLWVLVIGVFIFRVDLNLYQFLPEDFQWVRFTMPIIIILVIYLVLRSFKWYYWLAFIFYVPLQLFWFVPKFILQNGKFYLFISYASFLFRRLRKWKSTFIHLSIVFFISLLLINNPIDSVRVLSVIFAFYIFLKYNVTYTKRSIRPASFFGNDFFRVGESPKEAEKKQIKALNNLIDIKEKNLTPEEIEIKKLRNLANYHTFIECLVSNMSSSKGKSAFVVYWLVTFIFSIITTILLLAFINYQVYLIDDTSFLISGEINFGEFLRYTAKSLTYGGIDEIKPNSSLAKILEGITFFLIGFLYLMILIGFGYSIRNSKIEEETRIIVSILKDHMQITQKFVSNNFGKDLSIILKETETIRESVEKIRITLNRIF